MRLEASLAFPSAVERAAEILVEHNRDVEAAVREVVAGSERSVSKLVIDFCLERIPVLGCPHCVVENNMGQSSEHTHHRCIVWPRSGKRTCAARSIALHGSGRRRGKSGRGLVILCPSPSL